MGSNQLFRLAICFFFIGIIGTGTYAQAASLRLGVTEAPAGGTTAAVIGITDPEDVESFSLTLNFSSGITLTMASAGWFTRHEYYPASPFGPVPQIDRNLTIQNDQQTKVFLHGFAPDGTTGNIGVVTFDIDDAAQNDDTQVLSLSGQYLSKSSGITENFPSITAIFTVGSYTEPISGDVNGDGNIDLVDAILALQVISGIGPSQPVQQTSDVDGNEKIGMPEIIYILQKVSNQR